MRTNTNKLIAGALVIGMTLFSNMSITTASQIGTGSVQSSGAMATPINWNDTFPGTATGTINGLTIKAKILPTLNMTITGSGVIDLGNLSSATYSTGTVNIEIGTNATAGASVTARSASGGLRSSSGSDILNNLTTDGAADSYLFTSVAGAVTDSSFSGTINQTFLAGTEVNNSVTNHIIYNSARPQPTSGLDDITFSVSARPNAQSPAGNYSDTIIVTVTGTF